MKRISILSLLFLFLLSCTAIASEQNYFHKAPTKIGVVIIGGPDVKTPDFFKYVSESLKNNDDNRYTIETGTVVQTKYQNYWFDKGFLDEQILTKPDLNAFVQYSGYNKVLFLIVSNPVLEKTKIPAGWFATVEQTRASIEIKAFFADDISIIKAINVSKEDDSQTSELRAKRGAFQKGIKEIATELQAYLK